LFEDLSLEVVGLSVEGEKGFVVDAEEIAEEIKKAASESVSEEDKWRNNVTKSDFIEL